MKQIIFTRHGQSTQNVATEQGIEYDATNIVLTDLGKEQARKTGIYLKDQYETFDMIYCSSIKRCIQTATIICNELNIPFEKVKISDDIIEVASIEHDFKGKSDESIKKLLEKHPKINELEKRISRTVEPFEKYRLRKKLYKYYRKNFNIVPNNKEVEKNVKKFLESLKEILQNDDIENILVVSHGGTMGIIQSIISNIDDESDIHITGSLTGNISDNYGNCGCLYVGYKNNSFRVISPMNTRHLMTKT